jgi:hypothetical protein
MRILIALAALVLVVAACAPALAPSLERQNGDVLVSVTANRAVYAVTVTVLDAVTSDERCAAIDSDLWCVLGDLERGDTATIVVTGEFGVACTAAGYLDESHAISSYRPFACRVTPAN